MREGDAVRADPVTDLHTLANAILDGPTKAYAVAVADKLEPVAPPPPPPPPPGAPTWETVTAYTKMRPAFTPTRTVRVSDASQLAAAVSSLRAGDLVLAASPFVVSGEFRIMAAPSTVAVIDLPGVTFAGFPASSQLPAVWLPNGCANIRAYLDTVTNPKGHSGVLVYSSSNVTVYVKRIHHTGGDALSVLPVGGNITGCDFYVADVSSWGQNLAADPHAEKGTGLHGCQFSDASGNATNNRLAFYGHDGPTGACLQYGSSSHATTGNTVAVKAERMTKASTSQIAGTAVSIWGGNPVSGDFTYLEATDCQGPAVACNHEYGADFSKVVFDYARATRCNLNPRWKPPAYQPGPTYKDAK